MPRRPSTTIRVNVVDYGRTALMLRYRDPRTGKQHSRSSGTSSRKEADRLAAVWEADINAKRWEPGERVGWEVFRDQYEKLHLASLAPSTQVLNEGRLGSFARLMSPRYLDEITPTVLSEYAAKLRASLIVSAVRKITKTRAETTIKGHLSTLRAALNWAVGQDMLASLPKFPRIERARKAKKQPHKGRAITDGEFATFLAAVPKVVLDPVRVEQVRRLLWLIRHTGFRLSEALDFWWDNQKRNHVFIGPNDRPAIVLYAGQHKANEDETLPVTRECGEWLLATPADDRTGRVAPLPGRLGNLQTRAASELLCAIGEASGIVVEPRGGKFASAHDVRRLFVTDCLRRFSPAVVQKLARHESIETTMSYYAFLTDEKTADEIWNAKR